LFACFKLTVVCFIQGNDSFPKGDSEFEQYGDLFRAMGYTWMAILLLLFSERYIRELYSVFRHKAMSITVNWIECMIFVVYGIYTATVGCIHFLAIYRGKIFC
jgi:hypothetical protein